MEIIMLVSLMILGKIYIFHFFILFTTKTFIKLGTLYVKKA